MNPYQKATLLVALVALPLMLLFLRGMEYRGTGVIGFVGLGIIAALVYALRSQGADELPAGRSD
jgi:hypothetical protein